MIYFFEEEKAQTLARMSNRGVGVLNQSSGQEVLFVKVPAEGIDAANSSTGVAGTQECNVITIAKGGETTVSKDKVEVFNTHSTAIDGNTIAQCWYRSAKWVVDDTLPVEFQLFKANSSVDEFNATTASASSGLFPKHEGNKDPDANQVDFSASTDSARVYNLSVDYKINNGDIVLAWKQNGIWVAFGESGAEYFLARCHQYMDEVVEYTTSGIDFNEKVFIHQFGGLNIEDDMWDNATGNFRTFVDQGYAGHTETGKEIEFHEDEIVIVKKNSNYDAGDPSLGREYIVYKLHHANVRDKLVGQHDLLCHINGHRNRVAYPAYEYEEMHDALFVQNHKTFSISDGTHIWSPFRAGVLVGDREAFYQDAETKSAAYLKTKYKLADGVTDAPVYSLHGVGDNFAECLPTTVTSSSQDLDFYNSSALSGNNVGIYEQYSYSKLDRTDSLSSSGLAKIRNGEDDFIETIDTSVKKYFGAPASDTWTIRWRVYTGQGGGTETSSMPDEYKATLQVGASFRRFNPGASLSTRAVTIAAIVIQYSSYLGGVSPTVQDLANGQDIFNTSLTKSHTTPRTSGSYSDADLNAMSAADAATSGLSDHPNIQQTWGCEVTFGSNPDFTSYTPTP